MLDNENASNLASNSSMAAHRERSLLDLEEEVQVTAHLTADLASNDLQDCREEEVYGDRDHCEEVVFGDTGDSNRRPNRPWPRFEYFYEEEDLNPIQKPQDRRDEEPVGPPDM